MLTSFSQDERAAVDAMSTQLHKSTAAHARGTAVPKRVVAGATGRADLHPLRMSSSAATEADSTSTSVASGQVSTVSDGDKTSDASTATTAGVSNLSADMYDSRTGKRKGYLGR